MYINIIINKNSNFKDNDESNLNIAIIKINTGINTTIIPNNIR